MSGIDLGSIREGDEVRLLDRDGNLITVPAHIDVLRSELFAIAFGTRIYFARHTAAGWQRMQHITVVGHQPQLLA